MVLLTEPQIDRVILHRRALMLGGLAFMSLAVTLPRGWGCGFFSGFMLCSLGVYGIAFRKWRTEPGIWMLAVLLTVILGPGWLYFECLHWHGLFAAPPGKPGARRFTWDQLRLSLDCTIALLIFAFTIKLAATVTIENWNRTRAPA